MPIQDIDTIVLLVFENRSFDHVLGHLSLGAFGNRAEVDGLKDPVEDEAYSNPYQGEPFYPYAQKDGALVSDLPHERDFVATQLRFAGTEYAMDGFVDAYYRFQTTTRTNTPEVMGYLTPAEVPITNFLANQYAICDRWFAPLPASTQPNRLMLLSGESRVDVTSGILPPVGELVLDWLKNHGVRWRVYHDSLSFFLLLGRFGDVLSDNFRPFTQLAKDVVGEADATFPQVIILEPSYGDAPHLGSDHPNDNHPPLSIGFGEQFLHDAYVALTKNPKRWAKTMFVVTYDEHGGFYDHVPPLDIPYAPANANYAPFASTGMRVPGLIISPRVSAGRVVHETFDHTSFLQLLADRFAPHDSGYSDVVSARRDAGIKSLSAVLDLAAPRVAIPVAPQAPLRVPALLGTPARPPTDNETAFRNAATQFVQENPDAAKAKYPELVQLLSG